MIKNCIVCGRNFNAKKKTAKYCCKICANHSRYLGEARIYKSKTRARKILEFKKSAMKYKDIAKITGEPVSYVAYVYQKNGLTQTHNQKTLRDRQIVEDRKSGMSMNDCAKKYNLTTGGISSVCRKYGVAGKISNKKAKYNPASAPRPMEEDKVSELIQRKCNNVEYVSGYVNSSGFVKVRCRKCKDVFDKSMISIRHGHCECKNCLKIEAERKTKEQHQMLVIKRAEVKNQREKEKIRKFWNQQFDQIELKQCPQCGAFFIGKTKYCSDKCSKKVVYRRKDKRFGIRKINSKINAKSLYTRYLGICWICGNKCDLNDYKVIKDRNGNDCIVCGENYPSVDHIVPVCEGGLDTWDNVKLACRGCNTKRYVEQAYAR